MNLVKQLASDVKANHWWNSRTKVVVGVSTGVDSMVLLNLLEDLRVDRPQIIVAHVNHELRSASRREEAYIRAYCRRRELKLAVAHWRLRDHPQTGIEDAARQFRYRFFKRVMDKNHAPVLLTAHHLNDQAETVLMRLIRGGDVNELTGIHRCRRFANGRLIRPLLITPKQHLIRFAKRHRIRWFEDWTNGSLKITRNRVRHRLLPWMNAEDPQVLNHIGRYAHQLELLIKDNRYLNARLSVSLGTNYRNWWRVEPLLKQPVPVQWGLLRELFYQLDTRLMIPPAMLNEIIQLLNNVQRPQGRISVNGYLDLVKRYRRFGIVHRVSRSTLGHRGSFPVRVNRWYGLLNGARFGVFSNGLNLKSESSASFRLNLTGVNFPLAVRLSQPSDQLRLGNGGHQKVRRVWINQKLPNDRRRSSQVLETRQHFVLALLGYKAAVTLARHRTRPYLLIIKR